MQNGKQINLILLDFSNAFDKVVHENLLLKLHHYGISGDVLKWIKHFLDNRKQVAVINGINSDSIPVSSGVPLGSVLGPIPFLTYINDLTEEVKSKVRLFADETAMYISISALSEACILQEDFAKLELWGKSWDMDFNPGIWILILHAAKSYNVTKLKTSIPLQFNFNSSNCVISFHSNCICHSPYSHMTKQTEKPTLW